MAESVLVRLLAATRRQLSAETGQREERLWWIRSYSDDPIAVTLECFLPPMLLEYGRLAQVRIFENLIKNLPARAARENLSKSAWLRTGRRSR